MIEVRQTLVSQKRWIALVGGVPPELALGCVASFPPNSKTLRLDAFDPKEDESESINLQVDVDCYLVAYYEPFVTAVDSGVQDSEDMADSEIVAARLPAAGLRVGVLRSIADRVRAGSRGDIAGLAEAVKSV